MEHLPQLIKNVCPDSKIAAQIKCGRFKTHALVENALGKTSFSNLCNDLRECKFSLIIDESTDRSAMKHLCLVVRYYKDRKVIDCFFGLIPLVAGDATTLYSKITSFLLENQIPYKSNLIGFAADGANVMMGRNNSVAALFSKDIKDLFIMKCICHSFHLCASYACEKLPRSLENLVRDIYNYFANSPKRTAEFKEFQTFCNVKMHKILHPCQTRWLSVHAAIKRVLEQYIALKLFFVDAVTNNDVNVCQKILDDLFDPTTQLFLQFLDFVLGIFNDLNKQMQAEKPKIHVLYSSVCNTLRTLYDCFLKRDYLIATAIENIDFISPRNLLSIDEVYFGASVQNTLLSSQDLTSQQKSFFKVTCMQFYSEACRQIVTRFSLKNNKIKDLGVFEPKNVKSGPTATITHICRQFSNLNESENFQKIDTEWRILRNTTAIAAFSDETELFWASVSQLKTGDETPMFAEISAFVFKVLSLPHSSANVERIFSIINLMKTKQRNRLSTESIVGLLHTQRLMTNSNCFDVDITNEMLSKIDKAYWYDNNKNLVS